MELTLQDLELTAERVQVSRNAIDSSLASTRGYLHELLLEVKVVAAMRSHIRPSRIQSL
jgi:predicted DNA-binding protein (UPF0251 family)